VVYGSRLTEFERYMDGVDPRLAANFFVNVLPRLESEGVEFEALETRHFDAVFSAVSEGDLSKEGMEDAVKRMSGETGRDPEAVVEQVLESKSSEDEIRDAVREVIEENREMVEEQGQRAQGALMGEVMQKVDADGSKVSRVLEEALENYS
jgi:glutamyl-tRNA(Gln) amidotransferase subunit E